MAEGGEVALDLRFRDRARALQRRSRRSVGGRSRSREAGPEPSEARQDDTRSDRRGATDGAGVGPEPPVEALGGNPFQNVRHRRRFPFPAPRRGNAASILGGSDLSERLRPRGPCFGDYRRNGGGERVGPGGAGGVDGSAGSAAWVRPARSFGASQRSPTQDRQDHRKRSLPLRATRCEVRPSSGSSTGTAASGRHLDPEGPSPDRPRQRRHAHPYVRDGEARNQIVSSYT